VAHLIPQVAAIGPSLCAHYRGKGPLEIAWTHGVSAKESDEGTNVDAYLNTAMFSTQSVRIF
jgi:hypothetical protein